MTRLKPVATVVFAAGAVAAFIWLIWLPTRPAEPTTTPPQIVAEPTTTPPQIVAEPTTTPPRAVDADDPPPTPVTHPTPLFHFPETGAIIPPTADECDRDQPDNWGMLQWVTWTDTVRVPYGTGWPTNKAWEPPGCGPITESPLDNEWIAAVYAAHFAWLDALAPHTIDQWAAQSAARTHRIDNHPGTTPTDLDGAVCETIGRNTSTRLGIPNDLVVVFVFTQCTGEDPKVTEVPIGYDHANRRWYAVYPPIVPSGSSGFHTYVADGKIPVLSYEPQPAGGGSGNG